MYTLDVKRYKTTFLTLEYIGVNLYSEVITMTEALLSPKEVADILSVSPAAVRHWVRTGKLKGFKAGRLIRVRLKDVQEFLASTEPYEREDNVAEGSRLREYTINEIESFVEEDRITPDMARRLEKILGL